MEPKHTPGIHHTGKPVLAYIDSFSGLVPCKVLEMISFIPPFPFTSPAYVLSVRVTGTRRGYRKGEIMDVQESMVIPRDMVRRTKTCSYIKGMPKSYWFDHFSVPAK